MSFEVKREKLKEFEERQKRLKDYSKRIDEIGERMFSCKLKCKGIRNEPEKGSIPRLLFLENPEGLKEPTCIIVGINPGSLKEDERSDYLQAYEQKKLTYGYVKGIFEKKIKEAEYYKSLRKLVKELGLGRAILWTELCKCENKTKRKPPLQTFRMCMKNFLREELELFPKTPIIVAGKQAFEVLSCMFPDRFVIGVPHPTGKYSNSKFDQLFDEKRES